MALLVGEMHVFKPDVPGHIGLMGAGGVLLHRRVHNVHQSVQGGPGLCHLRQHPPQPPDGEGQHAVVGDKGHVFSGGEVAPHRQHRAVHRHQQDLQAAQHVLHGEKPADDVAHVDPQGGVVAVGRLKFLPLLPLVGEGPHHPHAGEVFLHDVGHLALVLVALRKALVHLLAEQHRVSQYHRYGQRGRQGQGGVHGEHEVQRHGHQYGDAQHGGELLGHKGAHPVHVGGAALDDVAGAVFHVPGVGQMGNVVVEGVPHGLHQGLRAAGIEHGVAELGAHPHHSQRRHRHGGDPQMAAEVAVAAKALHQLIHPRRELGRLAADGVVDGEAHHLGRHHVHQRGQRRAADAQGKQGLAAPQELQQEAVIVHGLALFFGGRHKCRLLSVP